MIRRTILALAIAAPMANAYASPRSDPTTGRAVFTGATLPSPTSITLNPAALGLGQTWELYLAVTSVLEQFGIDRRELDLATGTFSDGERVKDTQLGPGASIAGVWHPGRITTLGLELRLPPPELFPDDPALRYHSLGSRQRNYIVTGGFSLRVSSAFYFGVSVSHDVTDLELRYARDTALDKGVAIDCDGAPCGLENPSAAETYKVDVRSDYVSAENLKLNLGVVIRVTPEIWLGLAYHNTPGFDIQTQLDGRMRYGQAPRDGGGSFTGDSTVLVHYPASVDGEVRARLLPVLDLHVGGRWEDLSRMQAFDVRGQGAAFQGLDLPEWTLRPRGFRDAFAFWAGLEQVEIDQRERFRFGGRIGFETPSLRQNRTSPGNMSSTSVTLDAGAQLRLAPNWSLQMSYGLQVFSTVDVDSSNYDPRFALDCIDSGFDYSTPGCAALREGYALPTAAGSYSRLQHALRLGLRFEGF
ncbi:MAG: hypothetical protein H0V17_29680 [Deltaproteobacteria bacterium]|nr:hypothetical protein [Deltaproteobacteria bacterium]